MFINPMTYDHLSLFPSFGILFINNALTQPKTGLISFLQCSMLYMFWDLPVSCVGSFLTIPFLRSSPLQQVLNKYYRERITSQINIIFV